MLPKSRRATTAGVEEAVKKGKIQHSDNFSVRTFQTNSPTTVAVVVSKKVAATAVGRNKLKRRIRGALASTALPKNKTLVVYVKKGAIPLSSGSIQKELTGLLK